MNEEPHRHVGQALAQEPLVERVRLRRVGEVEAEQDPEQRDPRHERPDRRARRPRAAGARPRRRPRRGRARARRASGRAARSTASTPRTPRSARGAPSTSGDRAISSSTSRDLPMPAPPADLDHPALPVPTPARPRRASRSSSASRPINGVSGAVRLLRPGDRADDRGAHWLRLALGRERLDRRRLERRARAFEHDLGREDLARLGPAHHSRGGVDRVAEDPVRAAVGRAEVAGEHLARVDADPHRHDARRVHDLAQRAQHPLLVVAGARRRARGEERLDAPLADVRLVERHLVVERDLLDRAERSSSASASASGPSRSSSTSVSIRSMKAAVIVRCSGSLRSSSTWAREAIGMHDGMSIALTSPTSGARSRSTSGGAASRSAAFLGRADARRVEARGERRADARSRRRRRSPPSSPSRSRQARR